MSKWIPPPPWRHESELAMVRDWFYAQHAKLDAFSTPPGDMRQRAVDTVNLWLFKAGQLPPAVLSTANMTDALIHHDQARKRMTVCEHGQTPETTGVPVSMPVSVQALQSIYAMAFARFVNAFVDRDVARSRATELTALDSDDGEDIRTTTLTATNSSATTGGRGENSMYALAATIGMPEAFVDLRHQVTHGHLPSIVYLRRMTLSALDWLWERWWLKNATGDPARALWKLAKRRKVSMEARMATTDSRESPSPDSSVPVSPQ
ncbi:uncharacterized protein A1O9_10542 [Exophiala aquamarina CBS 119918]|uniref:Uncharacterized protein n=1 Tax=Exophiala aquamarina CBS 119918 TaxID=1182545 RepID=A0A072P1K7_9EURO|nr:uncharacterized protein A1O9_10542 [Exophiala aquamarina CBS 119918]KEF53567.1 hypothetical protein A1O9_10542 [Exophiala aquamarina CBS 119918]